jgi:hypothetical protein
MSDDGLGPLRGDARDGTTIPLLSHDVTYSGNRRGETEG